MDSIRPDGETGSPPAARRGRFRGGPLRDAPLRDDWRDLYHTLLTIPWWGCGLLAVAVYRGTNALFGLLYWLDPGGLAGARPGSYADAFDFSVETLGTIGYGAIWPRDGYCNALVAAEAFLNIAMTALSAGLIFARVSRPTARVRFTRVALINDFDGRRTFMFRAANRRASSVLEAEVLVVLARWVTTAEGVRFRRIEEVRMQRQRTPLFALTWTTLHVIDEASPFHGATPQSLAAERAEVTIVLSGVDESFAQRVHARHVYAASEIVFDRTYSDVLHPASDSRRPTIDYANFDVLRPATPRAP